jgi:GntR family transcriptional regulator
MARATSSLPRTRLDSRRAAASKRNGKTTGAIRPGVADLHDLQLSRRLGAPLHHQIFLVMRDQILEGRYAIAESLPTEDELTHLFGVSRITVRAALSKLEASGLIMRRQGVGTFVKERASKPIRIGIREQRALLGQLSHTTTLRLLEFGRAMAPGNVRSWFRCGQNAQFVRVVRIRAASKPVLLYVTFIPESIGGAFSRDDYARLPHHELIKRAGIHITSAEQIITAGLAEPVVASQLKIEVGAPLLKLRTMFFDNRSCPVRYLEVLASPAMFELHMAFGPSDWKSRTGLGS